MATNWVHRNKSIKVRWNFIIAFIKLFKPEDAVYEEDPGFAGGYWCVNSSSEFIDLCKWAKYEYYE